MAGRRSPRHWFHRAGTPGGVIPPAGQAGDAAFSELRSVISAGLDIGTLHHICVAGPVSFFQRHPWSAARQPPTNASAAPLSVSLFEQLTPVGRQ